MKLKVIKMINKSFSYEKKYINLYQGLVFTLPESARNDSVVKKFLTNGILEEIKEDKEIKEVKSNDTVIQIEKTIEEPIEKHVEKKVNKYEEKNNNGGKQ